MLKHFNFEESRRASLKSRALPTKDEIMLNQTFTDNFADEDDEASADESNGDDPVLESPGNKSTAINRKSLRRVLRTRSNSLKISEKSAPDDNKKEASPSKLLIPTETNVPHTKGQSASFLLWSSVDDLPTPTSETSAPQAQSGKNLKRFMKNRKSSFSSAPSSSNASTATVVTATTSSSVATGKSSDPITTSSKGSRKSVKFADDIPGNSSSANSEEGSAHSASLSASLLKKPLEDEPYSHTMSPDSNKSHHANPSESTSVLINNTSKDAAAAKVSTRTVEVQLSRLSVEMSDKECQVDMTSEETGCTYILQSPDGRRLSIRSLSKDAPMPPPPPQSGSNSPASAGQRSVYSDQELSSPSEQLIHLDNGTSKSYDDAFVNRGNADESDGYTIVLEAPDGRRLSIRSLRSDAPLPPLPPPAPQEQPIDYAMGSMEGTATSEGNEDGWSYYTEDNGR